MLNLIGLVMLLLAALALRKAFRTGPGAVAAFVQQLLGGTLVVISRVSGRRGGDRKSTRLNSSHG